MAKPALPTIIVDTREQLPYSFDPALCAVERRKLDAGDYSLAGFEHRVAVERKSLDDFAATLTTTARRRRFYAELARMSESGCSHRCIVVEGGMDDVLAGRFRSGASPRSVFGAAVSLMVTHGVLVAFCHDRQHAREFTESYLLKCAALFARETASPLSDSEEALA